MGQVWMCRSFPFPSHRDSVTWPIARVTGKGSLPGCPPVRGTGFWGTQSHLRHGPLALSDNDSVEPRLSAVTSQAAPKPGPHPKHSNQDLWERGPRHPHYVKHSEYTVERGDLGTGVTSGPPSPCSVIRIVTIDDQGTVWQAGKRKLFRNNTAALPCSREGGACTSIVSLFCGGQNTEWLLVVETSEGLTWAGPEG